MIQGQRPIFDCTASCWFGCGDLTSYINVVYVHSFFEIKDFVHLTLTLLMYKS